jgi:primosomal protein N' (replication factor Y)
MGEALGPGEYKLKPLLGRREELPILPETTLKWLEWLAQYYMHPIGQVVQAAFPPLKKASKTRKSRKGPVVPKVVYNPPPQLTEEQQNCFQSIRAHKDFSVHLLHGVTGSGKTEVYLHLLGEVIEQGLQGIVLVPEISLTPQLIQRFAARFPEQIAVIHSHLTEREKTNQWWDMVEGRRKILIGARSALFCPLEKIGLIVIDEEHEPSFKQEEKLRYHARDAAIMLAKNHNCPVVLGSATPSLETWNNTLSGRYHLHRMKGRVAERQMPKVECLDMREEKSRRKENPHLTVDLPFWMSLCLYQAIENTLSNKEQVALFLNRRGMAQNVLCSSCGYVEECPNCAISLTLHAHHHLVCHYCEFTKALKETCPHCHEGSLKALGLGTELIETDIEKLFPEARISRADRDEIQSREDLEVLIEQMESRETDILIGTQMIAKGLDFPGLTLVGLVMADVAFNLPDFRASERSFQLLTQVSGRAGRHSEKPGRVIIQTYNPEHLSVSHTRDYDYEGFAEKELGFRRDLNYPPFGRLASLKVQGINQGRVVHTAELLARRAHALKESQTHYTSVQVLGPTTAPLSKLRGKYRYHLLLKFPRANVMPHFCQQLMSDLSWVPSGTKVQIDIDPMSML